MSHSVEEHFEGRDPVVCKIYDVIVAASQELGPVSQDPKKTSIHLNRESAFAAIKTRRSFLILTIKSDSDIHDPRIGKHEQTSPKRWYHEIKIASVEDIDRQIIEWIRNGYELSG